MLLRRSISAFVCFLLLLPSAVALRGPQQPECCLRQGTHHCDADTSAVGSSMDDDADQDEDGASIHATGSCEYRHAPAVTSYRTDALLTSHRFEPVFTAAWHTPQVQAGVEQTAVTLASARAPPALN